MGLGPESWGVILSLLLSIGQLVWPILRASSEDKQNVERRITILEEQNKNRAPDSSAITDLRDRMSKIEGRLEILIPIIQEQIPKGKTTSFMLPSGEAAEWLKGYFPASKFKVEARPAKARQLSNATDGQADIELKVEKK